MALTVIQPSGLSNIGNFAVGSLSATGNVTGNYFIGNGSLLTGISGGGGGGGSYIFNGTSNVAVVSSGGNVTVDIGGTSNVAVFATTGEYITGLLSVSGNVSGSNLNIAGSGGTISGTGNIIAGNLSATGNVIVVGVAASGNISATGNVQGGNGVFTTIVSAASHTGTIVSVTGNVNGGNVISAALAQAVTLSATGNVNGGNVISAALAQAVTLSATGAVNFSGTTTTITIGTAATTGAITIGGTAMTTGNITLGQSTSTSNVLIGSGVIAAAGTKSILVGQNGATGSNTTIQMGPALGNGNVLISANTIVRIANTSSTALSVAGNITGNYFIGNGSQLTGISGGGGAFISNGTSNVTVVSSGGNVTVGVGGTSNVVVFANTGAIVTGVVSATGNITGGNLLTSGAGGNISGAGSVLAGNLSISGNINGSNIIASGNISITGSGGAISGTGNITGGNLITTGLLSVNSGNSSGTVIVNAGGNAVGNIGSSTTYFNRLFAQATTALYADLAEMYTTDAEYPPGTVLIFGGNQEVTTSTVTHDHRVAGVVSTNPAHIMNSGLQGEFTVAVALTGRVPVSVIGNITAGDRVVSSNRAGVAEALDMARYQPGVIIGKALQSYSGNGIGVIEVVVGRL